MPRANRPPAYRLHKARNCAVVTIDGKNHYLGPFGSPESHEKYARLLGEWQANGRQPVATPANLVGPTSSVTAADLLVIEVMLAFLEHAKKHYRHYDGKPTREVDNLRDASRPLRKLYGHTPARDFGPLGLRAIQQEMINNGLCRRVINDRIKRIRRMFRWAASVEL